MRLKSIFVRFYKSFNYDYIRKLDPRVKPKPWEMMDGMWYPYVQVPIDPKVTTIVGANESGKSHLLSAIEKAISGEKIKREDFCRYSQFFTVKQGELKFPDFGSEWSDLSEEDQKKVRSVSEIPEATIFDRFFIFRNNKDYLTLYLPDTEDKYTAYKAGKNNVVHLPSILPHPFRIEADIALPDSVPIKKIIERINKTEGTKTEGTKYEFLERSQRKKIRELLEPLYKNSDSFIKQPSLVNQADSEFSKAITSLITALKSSAMSEQETLKREKEFDLAHKLICKVARVDTEVLSNLADSMLEGKEGYTEGLLKMINNHLAESLNFPSWWVQDRQFCLLLSARDHDLVFTIRDRTGTQYSFAERSSGLKYFLSYYIQYRAHEPHGKTPEILLMDEPDAYLSSQAQQDLLKIFEAFSNPEDGRHPVQVVYVTHSPFLIDKNHSERIRVLEKGVEEEGTRVVKDAAKNHYEPLRSAFGAFVGETAFIGNCNLIVEGPADQILIAGAATYLRSRNVSKREMLDLNNITIVPAGGASHIPYLVYLARGRDVVQPAVIVLLDSDQGGNDAKKNLNRGGPKRKQLLKEDFILQIGDLVGESGLGFSKGVVPIEIEDLIPLSICVGAAGIYAREVYGATDSDVAAITENAILKKLTDCKTVFKAIEACFEELFKDGLHIEKVGFARSVIETVTKLSKEESSRKTNSTNGFKQFEDNFKILFRRIDRMKRDAERERTDERVSQKIDRLKENFLKDHRVCANREDALVLLEDIESMLDDSLECDAIKSEIQNLRRDYKLDTDMVKPVDNYENFKEGLEKIKYAGRIISQESQEEE
jgi:predicted ATP-dependent endonuclease of OLD family